MMAYQLSKQFVRLGVETLVMANDQKGAEGFDAQQDFNVTRIPLGDTTTLGQQLGQKVRLRREMLRVVRTFDPTCILCIHWDPLAYLARTVNRPYFVIAHGMELTRLSRSRVLEAYKAALRGFGLQGARTVFAVSDFTRTRALALGLNPERVRVIPNGVEWDGVVPSPYRGPAGRAPNLLLTVSRLVPRKGHDTALYALAKVIRRDPNLIYAIAGVGPERGRLESLTKELGLEDHVQFLGEVGDAEKRRLLNECAVFILPCRETPTDFEGFGIALLEAMQYARPVIAGRSGGVPDVVAEGQTGLLVEPNDPDALATAMLSLLNCPEEARRLGENGRRRVYEKYRWDSIAAQYLSEMQGK